MGLFEMGRTSGTPGVMAMLEEAGVTAQSLFERHHMGFWGNVDEDDWQANERALVEGDRLFSVYKVGEQKVYVITEADRSATTIMLADEY